MLPIACHSTQIARPQIALCHHEAGSDDCEAPKVSYKARSAIRVPDIELKLSCCQYERLVAQDTSL